MNRHWKRSVGSVLLVVGALVLATTTAASASADVGSLEIREYSHDAAVSTDQAEEALGVQANAADADIVGQLADRLGDDYAGIWFDIQRGEFVVPLADDASRSAVGDELADAGLQGDFSTTVVRVSWDDLEVAQEKIDRALKAQIDRSPVATSLDPRTNSVVITLAGSAAAVDEAAVQQMAEAADVPVEVRRASDQSFDVELTACQFVDFLTCDKPLRGGVAIQASGTSLNGQGCSVAFKAVGNVTPDRYVLTAGHCMVGGTTKWASFTSNKESKDLGNVASWTYPIHDYAAIKAEGYWSTISWPSEVAYWGHRTESGSVTPVVNADHPITGEGSSYKGQYVCHTGQLSGTSCGFVTEIGVTRETTTGLTLVNLTEVKEVCSITGDSGGSVFAGNTAMGIFSASAPEGTVEQFCHHRGFYTEITEATAALGVTVGSRAPKVTAQATSLNGNPGWVTVKGQVTAPGATISGKVVNIKLFKWENNKWVLKYTPQAAVTNNAYELKNFEGVGNGSWLAKTVFPAQAPFAESTSNEVNEGGFTVKDGYRIVAAHSNRCMDVFGGDRENKAVVQQWECLNPLNTPQQVFKLIPRPNGTVQIVARHSNRCVSVTGASQTAGTALEQYDCLGPEQPGQTWQVQRVNFGGIDFDKFIAVHSGQCMDVQGQSLANFAPYTQWPCLTQSNQMFTLQSVDSAPAPTETFITLPPGEIMNGQYGYVTAQGNVKAGGYPLAGQKVDIIYEKKNASGEWKRESETHPTLNSEGFYQYQYQGVGVGEWRAWTYYPGGGAVGESWSLPHYFEIKSGYRLIARHSNKCMQLLAPGGNGIPIGQWECWSTNPNSGSVFTLVPMGGGYFQIRVNSTGLCLDVAAGSTGDGAAINQWECGGGTNQQWQVVPIQGQSPWVAFMARHSNKCADVEQQSTANGMHVHQWTCTWTGNQQWQFQPVN